MDSKPHLPPLSSQKMKCSFLDYVQLLMISWAGRWTQTQSANPLQAKNQMLIFGLHSTSDDQPGWLMDSKPHPPPLSSQKNEMLVFGLRSTSDDRTGWSMDSKPICHLSSQKNEMLIFGLHSTSDDQPGWLMDLNPVHHPSPAKKMKCSFLDYVQLLMISQAGRWTQARLATFPIFSHRSGSE